MRNPVGFGQQVCKGGAKQLNSEIWYNFQGFSFFEVKLKLIIQCPAGNSICRVLIFKILRGHP